MPDSACRSWPWPSAAGTRQKQTETAKQQKAVNPKVAQAITDFKNHDPSIKRFFDNAYGYTVFPPSPRAASASAAPTAKARSTNAAGSVGTASLTQVTIGFSSAARPTARSCSSRDKKTLDDFKQGNFELSAQASAVAATAGAAANADYDKGVAVFTYIKGGLMYEASVGGQKFSFTPK